MPGQSGEDGSSVVAQQHSLTAYDHIRPSGDQNDCIGSHRQIMEEADAILQVVLTEVVLPHRHRCGGVGAATAEGQNLRKVSLDNTGMTVVHKADRIVHAELAASDANQVDQAGDLILMSLRARQSASRTFEHP